MFGIFVIFGVPKIGDIGATSKKDPSLDPGLKIATVRQGGVA